VKARRVAALWSLAVLVAVVVGPQPGRAAGCADLVHTTVHATGIYVPADEAYARSFAFAMRFDCNGSQVTVTVQRATGRMPVCEAQQQVEVVGTLSVSSKLIGSYYQIIDPTSVTCLAVAQAAPRTSERPSVTTPVPAPSPAPAPPPVRAETPRPDAPGPQAKAVGPSAWAGRYTDNRGTGEITFTLMRGASTLSGTWKMRTGGGGPLTGIVEPNAGRAQLRLENIAPDCPGLLEGSAQVTDTTFTATYHGHDCQGEITDGKLDLRPR
jgi:hypothetical protein